MTEVHWWSAAKGIPDTPGSTMENIGLVKLLKVIIENSAAEVDVAEFILRSAVWAVPSPGTKAAPFSSKDS